MASRRYRLANHPAATSDSRDFAAHGEFLHLVAYRLVTTSRHERCPAAYRAVTINELRAGGTVLASRGVTVVSPRLRRVGFRHDETGCATTVFGNPAIEVRLDVVRSRTDLGTALIVCQWLS